MTLKLVLVNIPSVTQHRLPPKNYWTNWQSLCWSKLQPDSTEASVNLKIWIISHFLLELVIEDCLSSLLVSKRLCWCQICRNWIEPNQEGDKRLLLGKIWLQSCHLLPAPGWHYPILLLALPSSIVATTLYYCCHMYYCWHLVLIVLKHYPLYYYFYYHTSASGCS